LRSKNDQGEGDIFTLFVRNWTESKIGSMNIYFRTAIHMPLPTLFIEMGEYVSVRLVTVVLDGYFNSIFWTSFTMYLNGIVSEFLRI
jgi:hypothetical protein